MTGERRFQQGDGAVNLLPNEVVLLGFKCQDCGRASSVTIISKSTPTFIDCNEERRCPDCQVKLLVRILKEWGCTVPEEQMLRMTVDQLLSLGAQLQES